MHLNEYPTQKKEQAMADNATLDETKQELAEVDARIAELKTNIERANELESLHEDSRFQHIMLEGYFEAEAERIFGVLTDPTHQLKRDIMENLMEKLVSTRNVKKYFGVIMQNASMAPEQLEEEEAHRLTITARNSIIDAEVV